MFKNISGVLLDLNHTERDVLARLLELAEERLEEFGRLPNGPGRYWSKDVSKTMAQAMIDGLREELELETAEKTKPSKTVREVEAWRRRRAKGRDHHHVSKKAVRCAYDRCSAVLYAQPGDAKHVWDLALEKGWKVLDHKYYGEGGYSDVLGYPSEDLICEAKHDKHGCAIYTDDQDCEFWPNTDREV